jgi:hypothetical protein
MPKVGVFHASGLYGQGIFVSPEEDIVFVITAGLSPSQHGTEHFLMEEFVLGSVADGEVEPMRDERESGISEGIPGFPIVSIAVGVALAFLAARARECCMLIVRNKNLL